MNKKINVIYGVALVLLIAYTVFSKWMEKKIVYVDTITLVEEYNMKQELATKLQREYDVLKGRYDSLLTYYVSDTSNLEHKRSLIQLEQNVADISKEYQDINVVVWNRINPLLASFGKERGYDLIIGANGMGTVLYGSNTIDVTKEVLEFINSEYEAQ